MAYLAITKNSLLSPRRTSRRDGPSRRPVLTGRVLLAPVMTGRHDGPFVAALRSGRVWRHQNTLAK